MSDEHKQETQETRETVQQEMPEQWQEEEKRQDKQRRRLLATQRARRILSLVVIVAIIVCVVLGIVFHDALNFDQIRRSMAYRNLRSDENGTVETFTYNSDTSNIFDSFNGGLMVASSAGYTLFASNGAELASENVYLENPVVDSGDTLVVVFDAGGRELRGMDKKGLAFSLELDEDRGIFSARVNEDGWMALTAQESGYKGAVTVYDEDHNRVFKWNSTSRFVSDAVVSEDGNWMAAVTMDTSDTAMDSALVVYRLNSEEQYSSCPMGALIPLDLRFDNAGIHIVGSSACLNIDRDGSLKGRYSYGNYYLRDFSMDGDGFTALLLGKYRLGGGQSVLVLLNNKCEVIDTLTLEEEVVSISAAGRYITVLYADKLEIYTDNMALYSTYSGTGSARTALTREDGSVLLASADSTRLYLP